MQLIEKQMKTNRHINKIRIARSERNKKFNKVIKTRHNKGPNVSHEEYLKELKNLAENL